MKKIWSLLEWINVLHEVFHFIPAWIFRLQPKMGKTETEYDEGSATEFQNTIITLMPLTVGVIGLFVTFAVSGKTWTKWPAIGWVIFLAAWIVDCKMDMMEIWRKLTETGEEKNLGG